MNQKFNIALKLSFAVSFILALASFVFLIASIIASVVFIILAIYGVTQSSRFSRNEKFMWTIAFIFFSGIAGVVYLMLGRKRLTYKN